MFQDYNLNAIYLFECEYVGLNLGQRGTGFMKLSIIPKYAIILRRYKYYVKFMKRKFHRKYPRKKTSRPFNITFCNSRRFRRIAKAIQSTFDRHFLSRRFHFFPPKRWTESPKGSAISPKPNPKSLETIRFACDITVLCKSSWERRLGCSFCSPVCNYTCRYSFLVHGYFLR